MQIKEACLLLVALLRLIPGRSEGSFPYCFTKHQKQGTQKFFYPGSNPAKDKRVCGARYYFSALEGKYIDRQDPGYSNSLAEAVHVIKQPSWADDNNTTPKDLVFSSIQDRNIQIRTMLLDNRYLLKDDESSSINPDLNLAAVGMSCTNAPSNCKDFLELIREPECASCLESVKSILYEYTEVENCANRKKCFPMRDTGYVKRYTDEDGPVNSWPEIIDYPKFAKGWTCVQESGCNLRVEPSDGSLYDPNDERFFDPEGCAARWDSTDLVSTEIKDCAVTSSPEEVGCYVEHVQLPVEGEDYQHPQLSLVLVLNLRDSNVAFGNLFHTLSLLGEVNWIYEGEEGCPLASSAAATGSIGGASLLLIICGWMLISRR